MPVFMSHSLFSIFVQFFGTYSDLINQLDIESGPGSRGPIAFLRFSVERWSAGPDYASPKQRMGSKISNHARKKNWKIPPGKSKRQACDTLIQIAEKAQRNCVSACRELGTAIARHQPPL
jgi:hypothetical protein